MSAPKEFWTCCTFKTSNLDEGVRPDWEAGNFPDRFEDLPDFVRHGLAFSNPGYQLISTELSHVSEMSAMDRIAVNPDDPEDFIMIDERCFRVGARHIAERLSDQ